MDRLSGARRALLSLGLATALAPPALRGQTAGGTVPAERRTVVAGAHYRAGWLHRVLLGAHYRDLWGTPIEIPVIDLSRFGGGLTPASCGGRRQTKSLRFLGGDGRQYVFRSVDKDPTLALPPDLRATFARAVIQDQISSAHPGGPLVVAPLLDAAGILHAAPQIALLPDDPRLRGFDCVRPGFMVGMIEERPTEPPDNEVAFAGAVELAATKRLFEHLEHDSRNRVDSRAFLAARLMDVFIGDWDRHHDQWRWARFDSADVRWWRPIPRDRDQAFARLDGLLVWLTGFYWPQVIGFGDDYPSIWRLTFTGQVLDRRLLVDLEKPVWDSIARSLQARLTDSVIAAAVRRLPPEYYQKSGAALERALRRRRDHLAQMSDRYYALLAGVVEIHGTDDRDIAEIERFPGGRVSVRLSTRAGEAPFYQRTFHRGETEEIRLYLHGGDVGLFVGTGVDGTGYEFRRLPYNSHVRVRAGYATTARTYRAELTGEFRGIVPPVVVSLRMRASGIDVLRFYGFGNETRDTSSSDFYKVKQQQYLVAPALEFRLSEAASLSVGPVLKFAHTHLEPNKFITVARPYGVSDLGQVGAAADFRVDTRDQPRAAHRGVTFGLGGSYYARALDVTAPFGEGHADASSYLTARFPLQPTLALRIAGQRVWGQYPFYEAAYIGGATTVRGFVEHRFAGDAAVYGSAELRLSVTKFFFLPPGELGVFGLGDAGRVYLSGETSDRWHAAAGGGLWLAFLNRANTLSVAAAHGDEGTRIYARAGFAF